MRCELEAADTRIRADARLLMMHAQHFSLNRQNQLAPAGAITMFAQINSLPRSEAEFAGMNRHRHRRSD